MPISERTATGRPHIVQLIAEALNARGDLYQPGGAVEVAESLMAAYDAAKPSNQQPPKNICRTCGDTNAEQP